MEADVDADAELVLGDGAADAMGSACPICAHLANRAMRSLRASVFASRLRARSARSNASCSAQSLVEEFATDEFAVEELELLPLLKPLELVLVLLAVEE